MHVVEPGQGNLLYAVLLKEIHKSLHAVPERGKIERKGHNRANGHFALEHAPAAQAVNGSVREVHQACNRQDVILVIGAHIRFFGAEPLPNRALKPLQKVIFRVGGANAFVAVIAFVELIVEVFLLRDHLLLAPFQPWQLKLGEEHKGRRYEQNDQREHPIAIQQIDNHGDGHDDVRNKYNDVVKRQPRNLLRVPVDHM